MTTEPEVLLVDDGELSDVADILEELEIPFQRLRGGEISEDIPPPSGLLVATPRRANFVRRGSPPGARPGRPVRIIVVEEDSNAMRRMLRRMGFHLLVRRPTHPEVWRLLIRRAVYQGNERRLASRVTAGSSVTLTGSSIDCSALLVDISNRGCRLLVRDGVAINSRMHLEVPTDEATSDSISLTGRVHRIERCETPDGRPGYTTVVLFDGLATATQVQLARLLNHWSAGPSSYSSGLETTPMPARSGGPGGLTLDDETDPAIRANVDVGVRVDGSDGTGDLEGVQAVERRHNRRAAFSDRIVAMSDENDADAEPRRRVLLGRDLSRGGMRVERLEGLGLGDSFRLALYGPSNLDPFLLRAVVIRDDGVDGFALRFENVSDGIANELEKMVACLPDIESLEEGEAASLGSVISEILPEQD